jgi:hypothetical protein
MEQGFGIVGDTRKKRYWKKKNLCISTCAYQKHIHIRDVSPIIYTFEPQLHWYEYSTEVDLKKIIGWFE